MSVAAGGSRSGAAAVTGSVADLRLFVFALFFVFGGITSLNDVLIPKLKDLFDLTYAEVMLIQSAFFLAYFLISAPAGAIVQRLGYMRGAAIGLVTMTVGCLLFIPASYSGRFATFLLALFVLAAGITIVQVVANPLICLLGEPRTAHSRLTFAQAFNSLGTTVFPYIGSMLILGSLAKVDEAQLTGAALQAFRAKEAHVVDRTYLGLAIALAAVAAVVWRRRHRLNEGRKQAVSFLLSLDLLRRPRFAFGTLGIFLYVGAEVAIGSLLTNFLMRADTLALPPQAAGERLAFYWGGAMIGRFIGAGLLRWLAPGSVLAGAAVCVIGLLWVAALFTGVASGVSLIAIGLFNSIMFPTIFSLASEGLGDRAAQGSGLICMAIVGGAIVPLVTGAVADASTLRAALFVPMLCYLGIAGFGRYCRLHPERASAESTPAPPII
ncbi:MAG TPA: sugar MFS transporter [Burkholderiaceae bacterium]|jgi:FHS family L-fucose permease-like MFS transporter|nr:sugar MFS transporter [Burkholderiaceae bacterium]